jgi:predicted DCC family thiol-disulfide oxidoreductase YuxK
MEAVDFQREGALDRFSGITHDACMRAMHLVEPDGRISQGAEAIARAIATRPMLRWVRPLYYLPGLRQTLNWLYAVIASNRYQLLGKSTSQDCDNGTCHLHRS